MGAFRRGGYTNAGFSSDFTTVDNLFLTQIAAYGIFSAIPCLFYFYYLLWAFSKRSKYKELSNCLIILYAPLALQAFSFDWESSSCICLILFGFTGYLLSHYRFDVLMSNFSAKDLNFKRLRLVNKFKSANSIVLRGKKN
jgi:hypothetical protein